MRPAITTVIENHGKTRAEKRNIPIGASGLCE
jgi:hypothetical protein